MTENSDAGKQISPSYGRPPPHPPRQNSSQAPPILPAKQSSSSEKEVETRLGMVRHTSPITPPSPLPSPPSLPERRPAPKPPPRSDEPTGEVSEAAVAKANDSLKTGESPVSANAKELKSYMNAHAENVPSSNLSTFKVAPVVPSSTLNELATVSANDSASVSQMEELQMRPKMPESHENSGAKAHRSSQFAHAARVSQFITAVEKSAKSDKPPAALKPGRLMVSAALADKLGTCLSRQQTLRAMQQIEEHPEVGIEVNARDSEMSRKPLSTTSEDTKAGLLCSEMFLC